jgi:transcriptional regulator with XRE-family HTH domain
MQKSVHSSDYRALRAELRALRAAAGLSQRDLAIELGVPHSWVAKVEQGERRIDFVEFCWLATACGFDPPTAAAKVAKVIAERPKRRGALERRSK